MELLSVILVASLATVAPPPENELEELGRTLKAAVLSGSMSEEDAIGIWKLMSERWEEGKGKGKEGGPARGALMPVAYDPREIEAIFRPEFVRRDLVLIHDALDLDRDQRTIAELLLGDYARSFDLASSPLREALVRYRRTRDDRWIAETLERTRVADRETALANPKGTLETLDAGDEWARTMVEVTARMEERLATLQAKVASDLAALEREGATVSAEDVVGAAETLRDERQRLRREFVDALRLIVVLDGTDAARRHFDAAMARLRIGHQLGRGQLAGETIDLWAALTESRPEPGTAAMLDARASEIAAALDVRLEATIERELTGLRLEAAPDRADRHAAAARAELAASVAVRDTLLRVLDETTSSGSDAARRYREAALRRGFPVEMRRRWSEHALAAALRLDDLGAAERAVIEAVRGETDTALRALREDVVANRIRRDPELADRQIDARIGGPDEPWAEAKALFDHRREAFTAIDDATESQLLAILTPAQVESLPPRKLPGRQRGKPTGRER